MTAEQTGTHEPFFEANASAHRHGIAICLVFDLHQIYSSSIELAAKLFTPRQAGKRAGECALTIDVPSSVYRGKKPKETGP